ncbi:hypothetical protein A2U01_0024020, partial [Trifolium medium]|nr:hypothetical protein [Trifolium medium]
MDRVLTIEQKDALCLFLWYAAPEYMRWYFRISYPYMKPLLPGDSPRPCEQEALLEEEAEREGPIAADLSIANNQIRQIASTLLMSGELVEGTRVKATVDEMYSVASYALFIGGGVVERLRSSL